MVLGASDDDLARQFDYLASSLPEAYAAYAAWLERKEYLKARQKQEWIQHKQEQIKAEQERMAEVKRLRQTELKEEQAWRGSGYPGQQPIDVNVRTTFVLPTKSVALAFLLALFFGPLGMLYSTVGGALVMLIVSFFGTICTLGLGLVITWPICIIWSVLAASSYNQRIARGAW
jgi:hypothetical protein